MTLSHTQRSDWLPGQASIETEGTRLSNLKAEGNGVPEQGRPAPSPVDAGDSHSANMRR